MTTEYLIKKVCFGTHPSTGKFYQIILVQHETNSTFHMIRRYGKATVTRDGGASMINTYRSKFEANSEYDLLRRTKTRGGYEFVSVAGGANSTEISGLEFKEGEIVSPTILLRVFSTTSGYAGIRDALAEDGAEVKAEEWTAEKKKAPAPPPNIQGWGAW